MPCVSDIPDSSPCLGASMGVVLDTNNSNRPLAQRGGVAVGNASETQSKVVGTPRRGVRRICLVLVVRLELDSGIHTDMSQ